MAYGRERAVQVLDIHVPRRARGRICDLQLRSTGGPWFRGESWRITNAIYKTQPYADLQDTALCRLRTLTMNTFVRRPTETSVSAAFGGGDGGASSEGPLDTRYRTVVPRGPAFSCLAGPACLKRPRQLNGRRLWLFAGL